VRTTDPLVSVRAGLLERIAGLSEEALGDGLPTRVVVGPQFTDPLFPRLLALDPELVVPGIGAFGLNRVRLLEVNERFVEAFMVGANHEWAREALWAEFPASLEATAFSRFWESLDTAGRDIEPDIHDWMPTEPLGHHVGRAGTSTVVLVRGDLVRRYPSVAITLLMPLDGEPPLVDGAIPAEHVVGPSFRSLLDDATVVVGFPRDPGEVLGGWYVCLEEPFTQPRAGLDEPEPGADYSKPPDSSWADLTWGHLGNGHTHIPLSALGGHSLGALTWARNSAHMAGITFQQPFRFVVPADQLVGSRR
jgi:hypothetical protein